MLVNALRCCPECRSPNYRFRVRKTVEDNTGTYTETKYRCVPCGHEWRERVAVTEPAVPAANVAPAPEPSRAT